MDNEAKRVAIASLPGDLSRRSFAFLFWSGLMVAASLVIPLPGAEKMFMGAGAGLLLMAALGAGIRAHGAALSLLRTQAERRAVADEVCPAMLTTPDGVILRANAAASRFPGARGGADLDDFLLAAFGLGGNVSQRLLAAMLAEGECRESCSIAGCRLRIAARRLTGGNFLWVFDQRAVSDAAADASDRVAAISVAPDKRIISGNKLAKDLLGDLPASIDGLCETGITPGQVYEVDGADGRLPITIVELRNSDGWCDYALLPAEQVQPAQRGALLAEPGLLEALPVPMVKIAIDGRLLEANQEARAILSIGSEALPSLVSLVEGLDCPLQDWLSDAVEGHGLLKPEVVRTLAPGKEVFLQITLGRTTDDGDPVFVGILNDATELKTLEAQFVQSQKMQAIGQLAGGVAHDFNNLLTAISGHCDLLLLRHDSGDPDYSDLVQISQNANRAASLVGQLLAFSRKQNLKPVALDLRDTLSDLAHLLNRLIGERIRLEVVHAPGAQIIRADRRQLEQVIINLVVNSRDAMPDGGRITVSIRCETLKRELVRDRAHVPAGNYVVIEVQDTGVGIPPESMSKIFEPFYTTKKPGEGTGLGLSTAYGIVKQTGGFIFADSTVNVGTMFNLYFPTAEPEQQPLVEAPVRRPERAVPTQGGVVLLVEDEAPVRAFASRALRMRGYTVLEAENAEEALKTLEDPDLKIDVFVTDVVMPGLDGPSWVRMALEQRPDTRTVFVSGYSEEGRVEMQTRIPNSVFLPKPFSLQQLTNVVNEQFLV